jgi:hypothetical protein
MKNYEIRSFKIYRVVVSPVVTYGAESCSLTAADENALRYSETRILRKIFDLYVMEVNGEYVIMRNYMNRLEDLTLQGS